MAAESDSTRFAPRPDEVREALARITASDEFRTSPQLVTILRFMVEAALRGEKIKAYTIAVEALSRNLHFDPQLDPIVRVEATRLRRALARYYAGRGGDDLVIIDLRPGCYVPLFRYRVRARTDLFSRIQEIYRDRAGSSTRIFAAVGVLCAVAAILLAIMLRENDSTPLLFNAPAAKDAAVNHNGMPTIYVELAAVRGSAPKPFIRTEFLQEKIKDVFARFDTINVIATETLPEQIEPRPDYVLSSTVEYAEAATVWFRLVDMSDRTIVWSQAFEKISPEQPSDVTESMIVTSLADALLQSYGVIRTHDRAKQIASDAGDPRYRCILETAESFRSMDPVLRQHARTCLEDLTAKDPSFAIGNSFLSVLHVRAYQYGVGGRTGDPEELDRALSYARRGVELNPGSGRAYQMLFLVLYARRDLAAAFEAGDKAIVLNPYDKLTLGEYGSRLVMTGQLQKGMAMLRRSAENESVRPPWQHFYLFLGSYLNNDLDAAAYHASQIQGDNYVHSALAQLLLLSKGRRVDKEEAIRRLVQSQPGWGSDPRHELLRMIVSAEMVDRLSTDLAKVGLPTTRSELGTGNRAAAASR